MRIAALYDIHGNLPALVAALSEIDALDVDRIVIGGDVVAGPMPNECLYKLRLLDQPVDLIHGNGESEVIRYSETGTAGGITPAGDKMAAWVAKELTPEHLLWIKEWPTTVSCTVPGLGDVLFCHATPQEDVTIFSKESSPEKLRRIFGDIPADLVVCGHVHIQGDEWQIGRTRIVRAGSVGMPFGRTGAAWALIDGEGIHLQHTEYDLEEAADRIRQSADPEAENFVTSYVLSSPPIEVARGFLADIEKQQDEKQ